MVNRPFTRGVDALAELDYGLHPARRRFNVKKFLIATTLVLFLSPIAALAQGQPAQDNATAPVPTYAATDLILVGGQ